MCAEMRAKPIVAPRPPANWGRGDAFARRLRSSLIAVYLEGEVGDC